MKLAEPGDDLVCPNTLTLYHRNKIDGDRYALSEDPASPEEASAFARSAETAQQL